MAEPRVVLATLCLNEVEWLPRLYEQHRDWPGLVEWVFVEAADRAYADAAPEMVSKEGLSVDGTTEFLAWMVKHDERVKVIRHGFSSAEDAAQGKGPARQRTLDRADEVKPDLFIVLDADEFYKTRDQGRVNEVMARMRHDLGHVSWIFRRHDVWRPPSLEREPLLRWEVQGGFWRIPCCHWFWWLPGMHYRLDHITPHTATGIPLNQVIKDCRFLPGMPDMVHRAFASQLKGRQAKHAYYAGRGEADDPMRKWYVESRAAWETWRPGDELPRGAKVVPYSGPPIEVFAE